MDKQENNGNKDYFGFNFPIKELLMGNSKWYRLFELGKPDDFDPYDGGLRNIFIILNKILIDNSSKNRLFNGFLHITREFPISLQNMDLLENFNKAKLEFYGDKIEEFDMVMHGASQNNTVPLGGEFLKYFKEDIELCNILDVKNLIIHPPGNDEDTTYKFIDLMCNDEIIELIVKNNIDICIENMTNIDFFGSLKNILNFRELLCKKYIEIGVSEICNKIKLCFDTGHLILWRYHHPNGLKYADNEILEYLPKYSEYVNVVHIKTCNSHKNYYVPFSKNEGLFLTHSKLIFNWLRQISRYKNKESVYYCLEISEKHQKLIDLINFYPILSKIIYKEKK